MRPLEHVQDFSKILPGYIVFDRILANFVGDIVKTNIRPNFKGIGQKMWPLQCTQDSFLKI